MSAAEGYYTQALHGPFETFALGDVRLKAGAVLRDATLAYATFGTLSPARDNAILATTWFSGTSKIIEQVYVGPGRALDPDRYFIVIANQVGGGLSTSPNNAAPGQGGPDFPRVRIADDVLAQRRLLSERFGIERLALVVGASMGAEQAYEWAVRFPDAVVSAACIAGTARTTPHTALFAQTLMDTISGDPGWAEGRYPDATAVAAGLRRHAGLWAVMGTSPSVYANERWRALGFPSQDAFVSGLLDASFLPMDANVLLAQGWKWRSADVARPYGGDLAGALGRVRARTLVMPVSTDMVFPVADCAAEQALIPGSRLQVLDSDWGHLAVMGMDPGYVRQVDAALTELLAG